MNCTHCQAETNGVTLCTRCQQTLTVSLVNIASYQADVLRIQPGQRVKVRSVFKSTPPPDPRPSPDRISESADSAAAMVFGWCQLLGGDFPVDTTKRCEWLERNLAKIAVQEWAGDMLRTCLTSERRLQAILDQADTGWYAGRCGAVLGEEMVHDETTCACACHAGTGCDIPGGCGSDVAVLEALTCDRGLYASPGHNWIRCPECGTTHNVEDRREVMLREARDTNAPVRVIAKAVVGLLDEELSEERLTRRIEKWIDRGQLHSVGERVIDGRPRRVYPIGDVLDLVTRDRRKEATA